MCGDRRRGSGGIAADKTVLLGGMKKRPWHESSPDLLGAIRSLLAERYPTLHLRVAARWVVIRGSFPVEHGGRELDRYLIEILFPDDYPERVPAVFEIGGRIPRHVDYHVFPDSGAACLFVTEDRWMAWPPGASFEDFLETPVRNYFLSQTHFSRTGRWPEGWEPRAHGMEGILEAYRELIQTTDDREVLGYMWVMSHDVIKGHWPCPCRSGKNLRSCHRDRVVGLQKKIPPKLVRLRFEKTQELRDRAYSALFG